MILRQLFYVSRAAPELTRPELRDILGVSQRNNRRRDVTGCLMYTGRHFAQTLEGDDSVLSELVDRIALDPRHHQVVVLVDRQVAARQYGQWSMGFAYSLDLADDIERLLAEDATNDLQASTLMGSIHADTLTGSL